MSMFRIWLSARNKENLLKLSDYHKGVLKAEFGMWPADKEWDQPPFCLLRGGPLAGLYKPRSEGWEEYSLRNYGIQVTHPAFTWLFSREWESIDNTPAGAAARVDWLLEHGEVPGDYLEQLGGESPLCYSAAHS